MRKTGEVWSFTLDVEPSGNIRVTITPPDGGESVWPGLQHLDLTLGAQSILLPVPPTWSAAIAVETDVAPANVSRWRSFDAHVVIGTSGYDSGRLAGLAEEWAGTARRCLVVPNFSVGAVLMMRFAELAAPHFASAEIIELHHEDKPDAPSGTSLNTAARIAAARRDAGLTPHGRGRELAPGALGAEVEGVPIHSVRAHGFVAHQEVILGGTGEYLTIRHDTTDYVAFAPGIILALRAVSLLADPLTVGLESILGI